MPPDERHPRLSEGAAGAALPQEPSGGRRARALAFYLPQFHPVPENDEWWGPGFTEWRNVVKARPRFKGHYQPHLPLDLGYYDLRLPDTRIAQAELAREHGVDGFCYYHYWFGGRRILERPFTEVLDSGEPDFPFALCWANENWTRRWNGKDGEKLLTQPYSDEDDRAHIRSLLPAFADLRYIRAEGKILFLVYRASELPDARRTTDIWREEVARAGLGELYLCRVESARTESGDPRRLGFDAAVEFRPRQYRALRAARGVVRTLAHSAQLARTDIPPDQVRSYLGEVKRALAQEPAPYPRFRGVAPSWDNTARRERGAIIYRGATPALYEQWLTGVLQSAEVAGQRDPLIFVNAWNEWAEGAHLEPCEQWGHQYLQAHLRAMSS